MMNVHTQDRQWSVMLRFAQHDMTGFDREHSSWRLFSESLSVSHPTLVLAPAALAYFIVLSGTCASRMFHSTQ